jgi:hypothetical protein
MPAPAVQPARLVRGATCPRRANCPGCRRGSTKRNHGISGSGWKRPFDDPIPLPRGRQLVTLEDAARYKSFRRPNSILRSGRRRSNPCSWSSNTTARSCGTHQRHESAEPARRSGVQPRSQRHALGKEEIEAGRMKNPPAGRKHHRRAQRTVCHSFSGFGARLNAMRRR